MVRIHHMVRSNWPVLPKKCPFPCSSDLKRSTAYDLRRHITKKHANILSELNCPKEDCDYQFHDGCTGLEAFDSHLKEHMFYSAETVSNRLKTSCESRQ
jgi:hypothetical protein